MEGIYGGYHIIYLILVLISITMMMLNKKEIKNKEKLFKILGIILLIFIATNRITVTKYNIIHKSGYTWINIIPNTICGMTSLVYALTLIFGKKDNIVLHFITYVGFIGGILTILYPTFLSDQLFFDIRSITGMLHHTVCVIALPLMIKLEYFKPQLKKWYVTPIGLSFFMTFGIFEIDALGFPKAMQINEPLISGVAITSWYYVGLLVILLEIAFSYIYEKITKRGIRNEKNY